MAWTQTTLAQIHAIVNNTKKCKAATKTTYTKLEGLERAKLNRQQQYHAEELSAQVTTKYERHSEKI